MKIQGYARFCEVRAKVDATPADDMTSTSSIDRPATFSPDNIVLVFHIDPGGWFLYSILITGPRVLAKTTRTLGAKRESAFYVLGTQNNTLAKAPAWAQAFATANHPDRRPVPGVTL